LTIQRHVLLTGQLFDYDGRRTGQCSIASDSYSFPSSPNEAGVSANKIALTVANKTQAHLSCSIPLWFLGSEALAMAPHQMKPSSNSISFLLLLRLPASLQRSSRRLGPQAGKSQQQVRGVMQAEIVEGNEKQEGS
jgi:hypothetical protein